RALSGRQAVHDRGHAALLELPQQEVALGIAERAHDVGARRLAAQGLVEDVEVDLGLARQARLEQLVRDRQQPGLERAVARALVVTRRRRRVDVDQVAFGTLAIQRETEHEVIEPPPVGLHELPHLFTIQLPHDSRSYTAGARAWYRPRNASAGR